MDSRVFFLATFACLLWGAPAIPSEPQEGPLSCDFSGETSSLVNTEITNLDIEGAVLEFPEDYVFSLPFKSGELRDALLLRADVNDFSSYPKRKQFLEDGTYKQQVGIRDWMSILVDSKLPLSTIWERRLISAYDDITSENYKEIEVKLKPTTIGLLKPEKPSDTFLRDRDIFVNKHGADIEDIIMCSKNGSVPSPSCGHIFEVEAYDIQITYARTELPRWKELRNGVSQLLQCFTIEEPIELPNVKIEGE